MKLGIRGKMIVIFVLFISLISACLSYLGGMALWKETNRALKTYSDVLVDTSAALISESIDGAELALLTTKGDIAHAFMDGTISEEDAVEIAHDLQQEVSTGEMRSAYIALLDGTFIQNKDSSPVSEDYDPRTRPWYQSAMKTKDKWLYTTPYISNDKTVVFTVSRHIITAEGHEFVLAADMTMKEIDKVVGAMHTELDEGMLLDGEGNIVSYKDRSMLSKPSTVMSPNLTLKLVQQLDKADHHLEPYEVVINGRRVLISSESMERTGWHLLLIMDKEGAYKPFYDLIYQNISIMIGLTLLSSIFVAFFVRYLLVNLGKTTEAIGELSKGEGDLTLRLDADGHDEVSLLAKNVNLFIAKLHTIISEIVASGQKVNEKAQSFNEMADKSKESLAMQKDQVSQIATAVNEMSATAQEVANNAEATAEATAQSTEYCDKGKAVILSNKESITGLAQEIDETSKAMSELEANTQNINNILVAIQGIAEQTNLLALNAAIEAARAGEQGRGFAVVADEVRVLSQRTQGSTEEIRAMIETLLENTDNAVKTMERSKVLTDKSVEQANEATDALEQISTSIKKIADMSSQIASAAEQQRSVTEEVNRNTQSVSDSSDEMVIAAGEIVDMSDKLGDVSKDLNEQVGLFKL